MLAILLILVLTLHLAAVGAAAAAPLACIWLEWREGRGDEAAGRLGRYLARRSLLWLSAGIVLGALAGAIAWWLHGQAWLDTFRPIPTRRLWFGLLELAFYYLCMGLYCGFWERLRQRRVRHRLLALLAAFNLLYHFPPLFSAVAVLALRPELRDQAFITLLLHPEALARTLHHLLVCGVLAGVAWMLATLRVEHSSSNTDDDRRLAAWGARLALAATVLQLPAGIFLLIQLPAVSQARLLGGDWTCACLFAAAILAFVGLLHHLAAVALSGGTRSEILRAAALLGMTMLLMIALGERTRREAPDVRNSKHEARNPKQIRNSKEAMIETPV